MNDQPLIDPTIEYPLVVVHHPPWNKNRIIGQKAPFKLKEVCAIRAWLDFEHNVRDRALLDIAIDSKMRGGDVTALRVGDVCHGDHMLSRASVRQSKTQRAVTFEITPTTRKSVLAWIRLAGLKGNDYLFPSRVNEDGHLSTRQFNRIVKEWAGIIGEDPSRYSPSTAIRFRCTIPPRGEQFQLRGVRCRGPVVVRTWTPPVCQVFSSFWHEGGDCFRTSGL